MFDPTKFVFDGVREMIGNEPDYKVRNLASEWWRLGVFTDLDLAEIEKLIKTKNEAMEVEYVEVEDVAADS